MSSQKRNLKDPERPDHRISARARQQHGVFGWRQALELGLLPSQAQRRAKRKRWERILPGVYRMNGTPDSWKQQMMASCLWAGQGAVISHLTAARLWDLEGLPWKSRDEPIHLSVPRPRHPVDSEVTVHRPCVLGAKDCSVRDGVPVTNLPRTLVDLAAHPGPVKLELALESALAQYRSFDLPWLKKTLTRLRANGRAGIHVLEQLIATRWDERPELDSALERRMHALLLRSGLPTPVTHYNVVEDDRFYGEIDFAYPADRVAILIHGFKTHGRRIVWERDQVQVGELAAIGWKPVPVTFEQLEKSEADVLARIRKALARK